jgi:hypothetical protein
MHTRAAMGLLVLGVMGSGCPPQPVFDGAESGPQPRPVVLNDDGGWCWFQDERALVQGQRLIFGSVAAGRYDRARRGAIEVTGVDLATGTTTRVRVNEAPLPPEGGYDDHNAPALVVRGDDRLLVVYSGHGTEDCFRHRVSRRSGDPTTWGEERSYSPSPSSRITYSNLHRLPGQENRILNFYRGLDDRSKPSVAWSDDEGETWTSGGIVIDVPAEFRHRPYVKYVSDGRDAVHLLYTEGHPRDFDNSIFHVVLRDGQLRRSDGVPIRTLADGLRSPEEGTRVFEGDADNVAWVIDAALDTEGRPFVASSVQRDSSGLPPGQGGEDHRYWLARWTGSTWEGEEIGFAGTRLYPGEDDYTGGVALVAGDPDTVFISTNADPTTGAPLVSAADGRRHWEVLRGSRRDDGSGEEAAWRWTPVTRDSTVDNLRPIVPRSDGRRPILLWLRGTYRSYTDYDLEVVALLPTPSR